MITRLVTLPVIAGYAVAKAGQRAVAQAREAPATPVVTAPRVLICGLGHLDVVRDVARGWTGTVHHTRVIGTGKGSGAYVSWHNSFARDDVQRIAWQLELVSRKGA